MMIMKIKHTHTHTPSHTLVYKFKRDDTCERKKGEKKSLFTRVFPTGIFRTEPLAQGAVSGGWTHDTQLPVPFRVLHRSGTSITLALIVLFCFSSRFLFVLLSKCLSLSSTCVCVLRYAYVLFE